MTISGITKNNINIIFLIDKNVFFSKFARDANESSFLFKKKCMHKKVKFVHYAKL